MLSSVIKCSKLSLKITSVDHALATKQWVAVTATRWRRETNEKELLASWGYSRWLLEIPRRRRKESVCLSKLKFNIQTTTTSDNIFLDTWTSGEVSLSFLILIIVRYVKLRQRNQEIQSCERKTHVVRNGSHTTDSFERKKEKKKERRIITAMMLHEDLLKGLFERPRPRLECVYYLRQMKCSWRSVKESPLNAPENPS